jgi:ribosomal protein L16 Arg81 hydroxylase
MRISALVPFIASQARLSESLPASQRICNRRQHRFERTEILLSSYKEIPSSGPNLDAVPSSIDCAEGPFDASQLDGYWGKRPLLIRNAFVDDAYKKWPTWDEVLRLASWVDTSDAVVDDGDFSEPGESARLIRHVPGDLQSFDVEFGPFELEYLNDLPSEQRTVRDGRWTLVLNDVDRHYHRADLADWMDETFGFLPRWRRDDAQISLAPIGGGIGPHVDNYDVFLIQASGDRTWLLDSSTGFMTASDEQVKLIPNIPVSILQLEENDIRACAKLLLRKGDMLYLPPRIVHWGTSESKDCMTLSVGCRAPGAAELVAHLAETVQRSTRPSAVKRYADCDALALAPTAQSPTISDTTKEAMKLLVREAIEDVLQDDQAWDELIGTLTTKGLRYSETVVRPYSETSRQYRQIWGDRPSELLRRVRQLGDSAALMRTPGVSMATSCIQTPLGTVTRLYFDGNMHEMTNEHNALTVFNCLERGKALNGQMLERLASEKLLRVLEDLVRDGFLQARPIG